MAKESRDRIPARPDVVSKIPATMEAGGYAVVFPNHEIPLERYVQAQDVEENQELFDPQRG